MRPWESEPRPTFLQRAGEARIPRVAWTKLIVADTDEERAKVFWEALAGHSGWIDLV